MAQTFNPNYMHEIHTIAHSSTYVHLHDRIVCDCPDVANIRFDCNFTVKLVTR
jgi:hypothetical protein